MKTLLRVIAWLVIILAVIIFGSIVAIRPLRLIALNVFTELWEPAGTGGPPECKTAYGITERLAVPGVPQKRAIILVHGIFGHPICTWGPKGIESGLIQSLHTNPEIARNFDLLIFGYPSFYLRKGSADPAQAAADLLHELRSKEYFTRYDEFVFVVHSMGGLVTMDALSQDPTLFDKVTGVFGLGVPFHGAEIASWGRIILRNAGLEAMIPNNSYLTELHRRFDSADIARRQRLTALKGQPSGKLRILCGAENGSVAGMDVVSDNTSALCETLVNSVGNHIEIAKIPDSLPQESKLLTELKYFLIQLSGKSTEVALDRVVDLSGSTCGPDGRAYSEVITDLYTLSTPMNETWYFLAFPDPGQTVVLKYAYEDAFGNSLGKWESFGVPTVSCATFGNKPDGTGCNAGIIYPIKLESASKRIRIEWTWSDKRANAGTKNLRDTEFTNNGKYKVTSVDVEIKLPPGIDFIETIKPTIDDRTNPVPICQSPDGVHGKFTCRGNPYVMTGLRVQYKDAIPPDSLKCPGK